MYRDIRNDAGKLFFYGKWNDRLPEDREDERIPNTASFRGPIFSKYTR